MALCRWPVGGGAPPAATLVKLRAAGVGRGEGPNEPPQALRSCGEQHLVPCAARSRSRSSLRMRFMCANRISTFLRSLRDWKASVLANART
jgi:hypothetical protein